ncbi:MAG: hypothetical protein PHY34_06215, partial [Patescibacteria group bacterium]|nr:hypothetical protein [Patescibacteria group bacterium]
MEIRRFFGMVNGERTVRALDHGVYWGLFGIVVLLPLFFLPGLRYQVELPKVMLFSGAVLAAATLYLLRAVIARRGSHFRTPFDRLMVVFIIFFCVAFAASQSYYVSTVGVGGYFSSGIIVTLCYIIFAYLIIQTVRREADILRFLWGLLASIALAAVFTIFQAYEVYILPWQFTHDYSFNLIAHSSTAPALISALGIILGTGMLFFHTKLWQRLCIGGLLVPMLAVVMLLDKHAALYALMVGAFVLLCVLALRSKALPVWWVFVPTCIVVIATVGIFIDSSKLLYASVSDTVLLDQGTSAQITWQSMKHSPFWGSGPQTFTYDFASYRPVSFNETPLWNLRFIKPSNEWFSLSTGVGLGGALALCAIAVWYLAWGMRMVGAEKRPGMSWVVRVSLVCSWLALLVMSCMVPFSFTLQFTWWLLFALGVRALLWRGMPEASYSFQKSPWAAVGGTVLLCIILTGTVLTIFFGTRIVLADRYYVRAQDGIE